MLTTLQAIAAITATTIIIFAAIGPHGLAWDRSLVWIGLSAIGLGLTHASHAHQRPAASNDASISDPGTR